MAEKTILLINPPTHPPSDDPPVNLGYLASSLHASGYPVIVIDKAGLNPQFWDVFPVPVENILFIGITLTIVNVGESYKYAKRLRQHLKVPVVLGGPHPSILPFEAISYGAADIVCVGEGEQTVVDIAAYYSGKRNDLNRIPGIVTRFLGETIAREPIYNINKIMSPDYTWFYDVDSKETPDKQRVISVFSSRGCPHRCTFCCSHNVFGRKFRFRSAYNVFLEILSLKYIYGATHIAFQDDELLVIKSRFYEFAELILSHPLEISMSIRTRITSIDQDLLEMAKRIGIIRISFGIESFCDATLQTIKKGYNTASIKRHFGYVCAAQPLRISFNIIAGFPWESKKHYDEQLKNIREIPSNIQFFCDIVSPIPYPGTELYLCFHERFRFTHWWLDPSINSLTRPVEGPLFLLFASRFYPLYVKDLFWKRRKAQEKQLNGFVFQVFFIFLNRHLSTIASLVVFILTWLSWYLWKNCPYLEILLLRWLKKMPWINNKAKQLNYIQQ